MEAKLHKQLMKQYNIEHDDARFGLQWMKMRLGGQEFANTDPALILEQAHACVVETSPKKYGTTTTEDLNENINNDDDEEEDEEKKEIEPVNENDDEEDSMIGDITEVNNSTTMLVDPESGSGKKKRTTPSSSFLPSEEEKHEELEYGLEYPTFDISKPICLEINKKNKLSLPRNDVPTELAFFGVTTTEWTQIWDSMNDLGWTTAWKAAEKFDDITLDLAYKEDARVSVRALTMVRFFLVANDFVLF